MINKLHWYLGYNALALMTEQERKHWLLKTDKKKTLIDPVTRDQYIGQIDNMGSDIIVETEKQDAVYANLNNIKFENNLEYIFELEPSAFPYTCAIGGMCFGRIVSTNYPTNLDLEETTSGTTIVNEPRRKHYRLRFNQSEERIIPFAGSLQSSDVFATRWIYSQNVFIELLDDTTGNYDTANPIPITFGTTSRLTSFYYPLSESLQTVPLEYDGNGSYHTLGITDNELIGYPIFWMCNAALQRGPWITSSPVKENDIQLWSFGTPGNGTVYQGEIYVGIDGNRDATPSRSSTDQNYVYIRSTESIFHNNLDMDCNVPILFDWIYFNDQTNPEFFVFTSASKDRIFYMNHIIGWEYIDDSTYRIKMSVFDSNCMAVGNNPLKAIFKIKFPEDYEPYYQFTKDTGYTGIRMSSGNEFSDMVKDYPYHLNKWDGLPHWLQDMEPDRIKEFMAIYALHNTPTSDSLIPDSRQTAALLFDLGLEDKNNYDFYTKYDGNVWAYPEGEDAESEPHYAGYQENWSDVDQDIYTWEFNDNIPIGDVFIEFTRAYPTKTFEASKEYDGLKKYRTDGHPYNPEEYETVSEWERETRAEWLRMTYSEKAEFYPTYVEKYYHTFETNWGYAFDDYINPTKQGCRDRLNLYFDYDENHYSPKHWLGQDFPSDIDKTGETYLHAKTKYDELCGERLKQMLQWWDDVYLPNHEVLYPQLNKIFGVTIQDHGDTETIKNVDWLINCFDENDVYVCKIYSPRLNMDDKEGISENGKIRYFRICQWAYFPIEDLGNEPIRIVRTVSADDHGSDVDDPIEYGIQFTLYPVDEITDVGRIYYLSNDEAKYVNNRITTTPKPARTVARICDIPTSFVQLTGITGISPVSVVDPYYVRTDCNFTKEDKDRLYNQNGNRWVRPDPIVDEDTGVTTPQYVFESLDALQEKSLEGEQYRELLNVDGRINPRIVTIGSITEPGLHYAYGDFGYIYVGGFAFQYNILEVNDTGAVTSCSISPTKPGDTEATELPNISLSNFDLIKDGNGLVISDETQEYGTAPKIGNGTGLKCTLKIPNVRNYLPSYGSLFDDLFALVKREDGLYLYHYDTSEHKWVENTQLAMYENKSLDGIHQTTTDSIISTMLPRNTDCMSYEYENNHNPIYLQTLSTPSFVHIIDEYATPIYTDNVIDDGKQILSEIDLCKLRCHSGIGQSDGIRTLDLGKRDFPTERMEFNAILKLLKEEDVLQHDCYLAIRWVDPTDKNNTKFEYGIISRGFHNLITKNNFSVLPRNNLKYEKYVNSDANTTIVWDVPNIGPMMWVFHPTSTTHEKYRIDNERQAFYIERVPMSWDDIDIYHTKTDGTSSLFIKNADGEDVIDFDIYTNSLYGLYDQEHTKEDVPYEDPSFRKLISRGTLKKHIDVQPIGNWTCVFPRVNAFIFENDETNTRHIPIQMQLIHSSDINVNDRIYNEETGYDESSRTLILEDRGDAGVRFRAFNSETSTWDIVL